MLRSTMSVSGEGATKYFDAALATSKYYGSERGQWGGKGAELLGLQGDVSRKDFIALAFNKRPGTDETLTVRMKTTQAKSFNVYTQEEVSVAVGDTLRITKNFRVGTSRFRNNELCTVTALDRESITVGGGRVIKRSRPLHLDQGVVVTSHASQGKTVDQVIVSVPVAAFSQTNEAQFYVSMSRARHAMHLYTDSKAALKEAVMRPSERLSLLELIEGIKAERASVTEMQYARGAAKSNRPHWQNRSYLSTQQGRNKATEREPER